MRVLISVFVLLVAQTVQAEGFYNRYVRQGGNYHRTTRGTEQGQQYSTAHDYGATYGANTNRYGNSHSIQRQYYYQSATAAAAGQYGDQGAAVRNYYHGGDPQRIAEIEHKERNIERFHHGYVNQMEKTYETQATVRQFYAEPRPAYQRAAQDSADALLQRNMDLYRSLHRGVTSGQTHYPR